MWKTDSSSPRPCWTAALLRQFVLWNNPHQRRKASDSLPARNSPCRLRHGRLAGECRLRFQQAPPIRVHDLRNRLVRHDRGVATQLPPEDTMADPNRDLTSRGVENSLEGKGKDLKGKIKD